MTTPILPQVSQVPLNEFGSAVITSTVFGLGLYGAGFYGAANGFGAPFQNTVRLGPVHSGTQWVIDNVICSCTSQFASIFSVYLNFINDNSLLAQPSVNGNGDNIWIRNNTLNPGDVLYGVWQNADPLSVASMRVTGSLNLRWGYRS